MYSDRRIPKRRILVLAICCLSLVSIPLAHSVLAPSSVKAETSGSSSVKATAHDTYLSLEDVEQTVLIEMEVDGTTDFFVWLDEKADLRQASEINQKAAKGEFVYDTLVETAQRTQQDLRLLLDGQGIDYRPFYIANKILVRGGDLALLTEIVSRPEVSHVTANHYFQIPEILNKNPDFHQPEAVEHNLIFVNADDVWALGITGQGMVLAANDSGIDETHPAIARHYRGCLNPPTCSTWDHNYSWWDATGTYPDDPDDGHFHGTWTTGIMIGDDGGSNQIGIAPGSQAIHCKLFDDQGVASDATLSECLEWDLAPWDLSGQNPRPDLAPNAVNNSWGYSWGGQAQFKDEFQALFEAGIMVAAAASNLGPECSTLASPGDYHEIFTVGSVNHVGSLPGTLSSFSSRGPSKLDGSPPHVFPDIVAPGEVVRSSVPPSAPFPGIYVAGSGTSAAGPHVVGLVGLMWSACPSLEGMVDTTIDIIQDTAVPLNGQTGSSCGGNYETGPNNDWGYGTIDALAAVQYAQSICSDLGSLEGTVYQASTMMPVENATITAERSGGGQWTEQVDASGHYSGTVFQGTYTATAEAYGYYPQVITNVVIVTGAVSTQDFYLIPEAVYTISGSVTSLVDGTPLSATINVLNTPLMAVHTDPGTGSYSMMVAEGTYDFRITAFGFQTERQVIDVGQNQAIDFALEPKPYILLVKDDNPLHNINLGYYSSALSDLECEYDLLVDHFVPDNGPPYSKMKEYRMVIWFSGDTRTDLYGAAGPNATDEGHLAAYLDGGGRLFLSSQDYLFARGLSSFGTDYLGIASFTNDVPWIDPMGNSGDPIGNGLGPYTLVAPPGWRGFTPDNVDGIQASPFLWAGNGANNSTRYIGDNFRTVFFAWPVEGIEDDQDRSEVLGRVIDFLGGCGPDYEPVQANFSASPTTGPVPLTVNFTNLSSGDFTSCLWDFGDGGTSTACSSPSHTYVVPGAYTVSLTVSGPGGTDTMTLPEYIAVLWCEIYLPLVSGG